MELKYDAVKDHQQLRALCRVLILAQYGQIVSGMKMRTLVNQTYGIDIDHHEFAYELDSMAHMAYADRVHYYSHNGGDTQYRIDAP